MSRMQVAVIDIARSNMTSSDYDERLTQTAQTEKYDVLSTSSFSQSSFSPLLNSE